MTNKKVWSVLLAYGLGQVTQLVIHGVCLSNNMYNYRQIPFCLAGGFVILFAVIMGVVIAKQQDAKIESEFAKHEKKKTYLDYAKAPANVDKGMDPFDIVKEVRKEDARGNV